MTHRRLQVKSNSYYYNGTGVVPPSSLPPIDVPRKISSALKQSPDVLSSCPPLETPSRPTFNEDFTVGLRDSFPEDEVEPTRGISLQVWEGSPLRVLACEIGRFLISLFGSSWNTMCLANYHFEDPVLLTDMFCAKINNLHDLFATERLKLLQKIQDDPETADRLKTDLLRLKTKLRTTLKTGIVEYVTFQPATPPNERMYFLALGHLDGCDLLRTIFEQYSNLCRVLLRTIFSEKGSLREIQDVIFEMRTKAEEASESYRRDRNIENVSLPIVHAPIASGHQVVLGAGRLENVKSGLVPSGLCDEVLRESSILSREKGQIKSGRKRMDATSHSVRFNKIVKVRCYEPTAT